MDSTEFEAAIQNRIVLPKSAIQYSAILFQTEYPCEEMVKKMNAPGNATQLMDKQKNGAGIWKYSTNTLTGGYIFCVVNDNPPAMGEKGDMMEVPEWAKNVAMHAVSGFLLGFCSAFVANPSPAIPELGNAIYGAAVIGLYGALKEVSQYVEGYVKKKATAAGPKAPVSLSGRML